MTKHTPGPWVLQPHETDFRREITAEGRRVALATKRDERDANARLIVAAPELLEALKACLDALEYVEKHLPQQTGYGVRQERIAQAKAVIARVAGNSLQ